MPDPQPRRPRPLVIEDDPARDTARDESPATAPPVPDPGVPPSGAALADALRRQARGGGAGRVLLGAVTALVALALSVAAVDLVTGLLARNAVLGGLALALAAAATAAALALALRELVGLWRLGRIDGLRERAVAARLAADTGAARQVTEDLQRLYSGRPELAWARSRLGDGLASAPDAAGLLDLAETELLAAADRAARAEIEAAARTVAAVTALVPLALADVAVALAANLRMIRRIAEIYGGRSGMFGSWRLLRRVMAHLVATGAVAVGDDLLSSVAGGGILAKLSRRFGEGVVNGALTARVGVAAIEVCRPLPFAALPPPRVSAVLGRALTGLFGRDGA